MYKKRAITREESGENINFFLFTVTCMNICLKTILTLNFKLKIVAKENHDLGLHLFILAKVLFLEEVLPFSAHSF